MIAAHQSAAGFLTMPIRRVRALISTALSDRESRLCWAGEAVTITAMLVSRRQFVMSAATLALARRVGRFSHVTAGLPATSAGSAGFRLPESLRLFLLDGDGAAILEESLRGYQSALAGLGVPIARYRFPDSLRPFRSRVLADPSPFAERITRESSIAAVCGAGVASRATSSLIIAPAALLNLKLAHFLRRQLESGATLVFESAAAFVGGEEFRGQSRLLRFIFGVTIEARRDWWHSPQAFREMPYVLYHWPVRATVRDFSRAVTLAHADAIAWVRSEPVAVRRRIGCGTLIFLGSPLGPHLLSQEPDAVRWLGCVVQQARAGA